MKQLAEKIEDELKDAGEYANCASSASDSLFKSTYVELSKQEINHAQMLQKLIETKAVTETDKNILAFLKCMWSKEEERILFSLSRIK